MKLSRCLSVLALFVVASSASAQKKSGSTASSPSAASAPSSPASAGTGSGSNAPVEVEWLAYGALDQILQKVANYACDSSTAAFSKVMILDPPTLQALQAYDTFYQQAESLNTSFAQMAPLSGVGAGPDDFADVTNAVASAATASTSETSFTFTIQDPTAAIVLLGKLHGKPQAGCKSAYYAGVYKPDDIKDALVNRKPDGSGGTKLPDVPQELANLAKTRADTLRAVLGQAPAGDTPCAAKGAQVTTGGNTTTSPASSTDPCVSAFNNVDATYNAFITALSTANSTTGQPFISSALQGYTIRGLFQTATEAAPVLGIYLSVAAAGGTQQDRKNLLTALFFGDWIRYSGGVSVNVIVFEVARTKSQVLFSDLLRYRTPLTSIKAPVPRKSLNSADNLNTIPSAIEVLQGTPAPSPQQHPPK